MKEQVGQQGTPSDRVCMPEVWEQHAQDKQGNTLLVSQSNSQDQLILLEEVSCLKLLILMTCQLRLRQCIMLV